MATRLGQLARGPSIFGSLLLKCCGQSVELTAYKSYSIPADVLGAFAVSLQTFGAVASRSQPCRPVSASILIWLAGFPTDFLVVGSHVCCGFVFLRRGFPTDFSVVGWAWVSQHFGNSRGFPTDFPVVGWAWVSQHFGNSRGFPTDFPVVGLIGEMVGPNRTSGSLPIADLTSSCLTQH
jgi:hypothetical protein